MASTPKVSHSLSGFSHVQLNTHCEKQFQETLDFYSRLGFQTVRHTHANRQGTNLKESVWLHLFASAPATPSDPGLTIRLSLTHTQPRSSPASSQGDDEATPCPQLCLVCPDLEQLETHLQGQGRPVQRWHVTPGQALATGDSDLGSVLHSASHGAWSELTTYDPIGTSLVFTDKCGPFSVQLTHPVPSPSTPSGSGTSTPRATTGDEPRRIGVLTSGGDAPGMNPAVRAVVRVSIARGCVPYAIYDGYQGLVDGGDRIRKMKWDDVQGFLSSGGTNIGTARCMAFKNREGRLKAAHHLIERGIDSLVVIGGDGSLTGADVFRSEWPGLVQELRDTGVIDADLARRHAHLFIVGLVGSIDNDMASTDMTIGAVSSLHRICESVDAISSTAISHSRAFVVEVMGRHCGWLALMAGICTGADWLFVPERPPPGDDWKAKMCETLKMHRHMGKRKTVIIVSEGAIDSDLNPIKADHIKDLLTEHVGVDTRVTLLGHVQRGGAPCAYDRFLATVQGVEAVEAVLRATPDTPSPMIGTRENRTTCQPLVAAVELTQEVSKAIKAKNFEMAMELRSSDFADVYEAFINTSTIRHGRKSGLESVPAQKQLRMAVMHVGAPAGGMNPATRAIVRYALNRGHTPLTIASGFPGLIRGEVVERTWMGVDGWSVEGGSRLGTNREQPTLDLGMVAYQLQRHNIQSLVIIGGFEAYSALLTLYRHRAEYPAFCIPMVLIPATISNNVPGTDYSLGSDTSLNALVEACDRIKQSASASRRRVFVVETQGGNCGYLATVGGLITGAVAAYIPEEKLTLGILQEDIRHLRYRYSEEDDRNMGRIVLRNEKASRTYTTQVLGDILQEESNGLYGVKTSVLGHLMQGGTPSPLDRYRATLLAAKCIQWVEQLAWACLDSSPDASAQLGAPSLTASVPHVVGSNNAHHHNVAKGSSVSGPSRRVIFHRAQEATPTVYTTAPTSATVVGFVAMEACFTPVEDLVAETDFDKRRSRHSWWMPVHDMIALFAKYGMYPGQEQKYPSQQQAAILDAKALKEMALAKEHPDATANH